MLVVDRSCSLGHAAGWVWTKAEEVAEDIADLVLLLVSVSLELALASSGSGFRLLLLGWVVLNHFLGAALSHDCLSSDDTSAWSWRSRLLSRDSNCVPLFHGGGLGFL